METEKSNVIPLKSGAQAVCIVRAVWTTAQSRSLLACDGCSSHDATLISELNMPTQPQVFRDRYDRCDWIFDLFAHGVDFLNGRFFPSKLEALDADWDREDAEVRRRNPSRIGNAGGRQYPRRSAPLPAYPRRRCRSRNTGILPAPIFSVERHRSRRRGLELPRRFRQPAARPLGKNNRAPAAEALATATLRAGPRRIPVA